MQRNIRQTFMLVLVTHVASALGAALVLYHGMGPTMVFNNGGLLAGLYHGSRNPIELDESDERRSLAAPADEAGNPASPGTPRPG